MTMVIIVLAVIVVLFIVGVGGGAAQGSNQTVNLNTGWITSIQNLFARPQPLTGQDISTVVPTNCFSKQQSTFVIAQGGVCTITIAASSSPHRTTQLSSTSGTIIGVELVQPGILTSTLTIPNSNGNNKLDIFKDGGTMKVTCQAGIGGCRVQLR